MSPGTVCRIKRRFLRSRTTGRSGGSASSLAGPPKLDEIGEAHLIALACSSAPDGHDHWTLRLLSRTRLWNWVWVDSISHEGIRKRLKKNELKPWQKKEWCIPEVSADFVASMEEVTGTCTTKPHDPKTARGVLRRVLYSTVGGRARTHCGTTRPAREIRHRVSTTGNPQPVHVH